MTWQFVNGKANALLYIVRTRANSHRTRLASSHSHASYTPRLVALSRLASSHSHASPRRTTLTRLSICHRSHDGRATAHGRRRAENAALRRAAHGAAAAHTPPTPEARGKAPRAWACGVVVG